MNKKACLITLNDEPVLILFCNNYYISHIMNELKNEHFSEIYGVDMGKNTQDMELAYEKEYAWCYWNVDHLTDAEAEKKYPAIAAKLAQQEQL